MELILENVPAVSPDIVYIPIPLEATVSIFVPQDFSISFGSFVANILGKIQSQILFSILQLIKFNLMLEVYSSLSLFIEVSTAFLVMRMLIFCFVKLLR